MPLVKSLLFWLILGCSSLLTQVAQAQTCPVTPNAPACTFEVTDARTGATVDRLCVGRAVRFTPCSSRDLSLVYTYQVTLGNAVLPNPCGLGFLPASTTHTPTQAGFITVTENSQANGGTPIIYYQVFQVVDSPVPGFTVAACAPGSVQVTLPDTPYDSYDVQIGTGTPATAAPGAVVSYPVPAGANSVTVTGRYADNRLCTNVATKPILQLASPSALVIRTITLQGPDALLDVAPLATGYRYFVESENGAGVYQPLPAAVQNSPTSFTVPNAQPGRYRLRSADACAEEISISDPVSTLTLTVTAAERRNELTWQLLDNPDAYELTRNGTPVAIPLQPSARAYSDTSVACGVQYTYRLTARYFGASTSVSNAVQVRATATQPPATPRLFASFDLRNRIVLTASIARFPTTGQLTYASGTRTLATTPNRILRDSSVTSFSPESAPCFQISFVDDCSNRSADSAPFCPAVLAAEFADFRGSSVRLTWSELRGATGSLSYRLLILNPDNSVLRSLPVASGNTYMDAAPPATSQQVRYRLEVTGPNLLQPSYSNVASVTRRLEAFVPTAFTPNGDGLNDVLEVKGRFLKTYRFTVVDRNGQEVFQSTNPSQTWDGRVRNQLPVPGSFVWRFEAVDEAGQLVVQRGTVTIVK